MVLSAFKTENFIIELSFVFNKLLAHLLHVTAGVARNNRSIQGKINENVLPSKYGHLNNGALYVRAKNR